MFQDGIILAESTDNYSIVYWYDESNTLVGFFYTDKTVENPTTQTYVYSKNAQGDITGILDTNANLLVSYTYDSWGNITSITDVSLNNIGTINPMRYRGYYFDNETNYYYLQSRYYNPEICRFINADNPAVLINSNPTNDWNLFSYCHNNPIAYNDITGCGPWTKYLTLRDFRTIHNMVKDEVFEKLGGYIKADREKYVKGDKGRGFLDVYDKTKNQYYEIKSIGSAELKSTKKQMEKYDAAKVLGKKQKVTRGTKKFSGSFYYGAWKIEYYSYKNGLVVYTHDFVQKRYNTAAAVATVAALAGITALTIASGGATASAYAFVFV